MIRRVLTNRGSVLVATVVPWGCAAARTRVRDLPLLPLNPRGRIRPSNYTLWELRSAAVLPGVDVPACHAGSRLALALDRGRKSRR